MDAMDEDHPFELEVSKMRPEGVLSRIKLTTMMPCRCTPATMLATPRLTGSCSLLNSGLAPHLGKMRSVWLLLSLARQVSGHVAKSQATHGYAETPVFVQTENTHKYLDAASRLPGSSVDRYASPLQVVPAVYSHVDNQQWTTFSVTEVKSSRRSRRLPRDMTD